VLIDDVSLAEMVMVRSVPDDIGTSVVDCPDFIDDVLLERLAATCFASHDICFDETGRARVSCGYQRQ
jgi:hypothetical protein